MAGWFTRKPRRSKFQRLIKEPRPSFWRRLRRWRRTPQTEKARSAFATPRTRLRRFWHGAADPVFYLKAVIGIAAGGLIVLPVLADAGIAIFSTRSVEGCRVVSVTDGDTVRLWCPGHGLERARLTGFDTPEAFSPKCASEFARATAATWHLRRVLAQTDKLSVQRGGTDRSGRRLVSMQVDGVPLSRVMIRAGHARAYGGGARRGWC